MGKRKVKSEEELSNIKLPVANDVIGTAQRMLGFDRILVKCQDGRNASAESEENEAKNVDKAWRHRVSLSTGLPVRRAG